MAKKKKKVLEVVGDRKLRAALERCLDQDLALRRGGHTSHLWLGQFDDDELSLSGEQLRIGDAVVEMGQILDRLEGTLGQRCYRFYYNLHDNVVRQLRLLAPFSRRAFLQDFALFSTHPAREGGINALGIMSQDPHWILLVTQEPGSGVSMEFCGTAKQTGQLDPSPGAAAAGDALQ